MLFSNNIMPTLIACLSTGKGTWSEVSKLIDSEKWDKIFLITNAFGKEKFEANAEFILIDSFQDVKNIVDQIKKQLDGKVTDFEVALNFVSGSGKEHMAILEGVLELGLNFRLITLNKDGKMVSLGLERK